MIKSGEINNLIVENVNDLVTVIDEGYRFEYINETVHKRLTGYSNEDLIGKEVLSFIHLEDHKKILQEFNNSLQTGIDFTEIRFKNKEGHFIWIESNGKQFVDKDGKKKFLTISRDITKRKTAEERLKDSEEKLKKSEFKLQELFKELGSIYKLSKLIENPNTNIQSIFHGTLAIIPSAFQFPDIVCARILYKNNSYSTINFKTTNWKLLTKEMINKNTFEIEVYYLEERVFLKEEIDIIREFGLRLKSSIEEREAKKRLKESEEKYRIISETAYDLIIVLNKKFKYEYINENAFQQILGYSKEDLLGKSALKFAHPDDVSNTTRILFDGFKQGKGEAEFRLKHKDGHWLWFEGKGKTFTDNNGDLKAIIISRDITERKLIEQKLKASEERYRFISETAYDLIGVLNKKFRHDYINENAFIQILGYSSKDLLGKSVLKFIHPDDLTRIAKTLFEGFKQGRGEGELRFKHKDGHWVWIEARGQTYSDSNGEMKAIIISRDITERKLAEEKLKESEKKYRKAYNRAKFYKDLFTHDMNNILAIITSSVELIPYYLTESQKSKDIKGLTTIVQNQVDRGAKLISNVNFLSNLEEEEILTQPTEACDLMRSSVEFVKEAYKNGVINIDFSCSEDQLIVNANELLQDVFDNILINAMKYNENPNVEISINVSKTQVDGIAFNKFEFTDNGIGVPDNRKKIIFKRGNRELKGSKGMGIGLSLVKKIIKSYNGKIWVEDKVKGDYSKGSNFILLIPDTV